MILIMKNIFLMAFLLMIMVSSCRKIKTEQAFPEIKDQLETQQDVWTAERIEQIAKQKKDSIDRAKIDKPNEVDPNSLMNKKNILIAYVEVNNRAFKNVTCFLNDEGKPVIDLAWVFAPNININSGTKKAYITYNKQVQGLINKGYIRYVQSKGIKVGMTLLGNHDNAGFRNFKNLEEATDFAQHVAIEVRRLGLDAIDFDDEYSENPSWANNESFVMVVSEIKRLLPDKFVHCYIFGGASASSYKGKRMGDVADAGASAFYPQTPSPGSAGFPIERLFPSTKPFSGGGYPEATLRSLMVQGYKGIMMFDFNMFPNNYLDILKGYVKGVKEQNVIEIPGCVDRRESDDVNL
ncbi:hypothetical protein FBD94_12610 [Pedobacter hiemivivus]|uniref:Uncharacterized protein n=2 Tax=Pedobacter hiemivivus TaxID=2530454 RepID=A0A4U1GIV9_9SPHI|nr:hypothetical protein FBD94_12610 [Pedobacter hiemivivus]